MSSHWINTQNDLNTLLSCLEGLKEVVIDTEADSFHHFQEKLCLVQLGLPQGVYFVDPLANLELSGLWKALGRLKWKIHAADYDLRLIRKKGGVVPTEIFDTFIAAQILGKQSRSYSALVEEYTGKTLSKANQKADWTIRPLSESMLEYAAADVLYLDAIIEKLTEELDQKVRREWFNQSCQRQLRVVQGRDDEIDPDAWQISGHHLLSPAGRRFLKTVWEWRQKEAEQRDLAPFRVVRNDLIIDLLIRFEKNPEAEFPVPPFIKGEAKQRLVSRIQSARDEEPLPFCPPARPAPMSLATERRFNQLREIRQKKAEELQMDPGYLASKQILIELAENPDLAPTKLLKDDKCCQWQLELLKV